MPSPTPLYYDTYYHIYNRGINGEILFREARNYKYFLNLYAKYIPPIAKTYAYCLLSNHFHFLLRVRPANVRTDRDAGSSPGPADPSRQFNKLFVAYAKAFNKAYQRTGALFERPFKRKHVSNERYLTHLVIYIHQNPERHGISSDFKMWAYSSYQAILGHSETRIERDQVLAWFGSRHDFAEAHQSAAVKEVIAPLIAGDWV